MHLHDGRILSAELVDKAVQLAEVYLGQISPDVKVLYEYTVITLSLGKQAQMHAADQSRKQLFKFTHVCHISFQYM